MNQKGFSSIILLAALALLVIGGIYYYVSKSKVPASQTTTTNTSSSWSTFQDTKLGIAVDHPKEWEEKVVYNDQASIVYISKYLTSVGESTGIIIKISHNLISTSEKYQEKCIDRVLDTLRFNSRIDNPKGNYSEKQTMISGEEAFVYTDTSSNKKIVGLCHSSTYYEIVNQFSGRPETIVPDDIFDKILASFHFIKS